MSKLKKKFPLFAFFDPMSFYPLSFNPVSFDPLSFDPLSFDLLSFDLLSFDLLLFDLLSVNLISNKQQYPIFFNPMSEQNNRLIPVFLLWPF